MRNILTARTRVNAVLKELIMRREEVARLRGQGPGKGLALEEVLYAMSKTKSAEIKEMISSVHHHPWRSYKPPVTGKDLIALGFKKGKLLGDTLRLIRDKGLNGEIQDFKQAMAFARKRLDEAGNVPESSGLDEQGTI
ncbi:MAG: hypothetical protein MZV70_42370 [Desulfobacterales bacterium]|nr:hypothetical protein [Desulfobacterales bacterium]